MIRIPRIRIRNTADPHPFFADLDPDPAVFLNADPDPETALQNLYCKVLKKTKQIAQKIKTMELVHNYFI